MARLWPSLAFSAALALAATAPAVPQTRGSSEAPATLIADRVEVTADGVLVATGTIEVYHGTARLRAKRIVYDPETETLDIEGPIAITDGETGTILLADQAEMDTDLRNGILTSARLVLDRQLQLAAAEITRIEGRYTQLTKTTTSSCEVCAKRPVPLWQIRSDSVVHDELERQLYFENARLDVVGVPVLWVPRLRLPDPTLERATGFLVPSLRSTDELGLGIKLPYFIKLGDHKDLTLTPYVSADRTQTLEARYRQAFRFGRIELNGAVSNDDIRPGEVRSYLFADGDFDLPGDFKLAFDLQTVSDDGYLFDYDYSGADRLVSQIAIDRVRRDRLVSASFVGFYSLRSNEDNETQPFLASDASWVRRFVPGGLGGVARVEVATHSHYRNSNLDMIGRDVGRITGLVDWRREWISATGIQLSANTQMRVDHTIVGQDSTFDPATTEVTPTAALELRWPWIRKTGAVTEIIEPVAMVAFSPDRDQITPRDESTQLELDPGNLFALNRNPAGDVLERGLRANLGLTYSRMDPDGLSMNLTFGRVFRTEPSDEFRGFDILEGDRSNWLVAARVELPNRLAMETRTLWDRTNDPTRSDTRFDWQGDMVAIGGTYTWLRADDEELRPVDTNEWRLDGAWQYNENWRVDTDLRYDLRLDRMASAQLGLEYRTECAVFDFSVRRRFADSAAIRPTTDFNFEVSLSGFGTQGDGRPKPRRPGCAH